METRISIEVRTETETGAVMTTCEAGTVVETTLAMDTVIMTADEQVHNMTTIVDRPSLYRVKHRGGNQKTCTPIVGAILRGTGYLVGEVPIFWKGLLPITSLCAYETNSNCNSRRLQRESKVVSVWPPSPKAPARSSYVFVGSSIGRS